MAHYAVKILLIILLLTSTRELTAQVRPGEPPETQVYEFFHQDTVAGRILTRNYNPTGCIALSSGALMISAEVEAYYPHPADTLYHIPAYEMTICSGSVLKLDNNFDKAWELFFQERRVERIVKTSESTLLVAGERIDQKKFWLAAMDTGGHIMWQKEYHFKLEPHIGNLQVDGAGNAYLLVDAEQRVPIALLRPDRYRRKGYRLKFTYHIPFRHSLYLLKVSNKGAWRWSKTLDHKRLQETYGQDLLLTPQHIFASSVYMGERLKEGKWVSEHGSLCYRLNNHGRRLSKTSTSHYHILNDEAGLLTAQSAHDTVQLYNNDLPAGRPLILKEAKEMWVQKWLRGARYNYILASWDHNLGCSVITLNRDNTLKSYLKDDLIAQSSDAVDIAEKPDGILILLSGNSRQVPLNEQRISYMSITRIKQR